MDPTVPLVSVLTCAVLGFLVWERLAPAMSGRWATWVALLVLVLAFALFSPLFALFVAGMGEMHPPTRLEYMAGGCFLGLTAISFLHDEMWWSKEASDVALTHVLPLVAACGGMLALWSPNLMGLGVGVGLYGVARWAAEKGKEAGAAARAVLAPLAALLGAAILYGEAATFEMAALGRFLWQLDAPHPFGLYLGLGLIVGGAALSTGLIPPFGTSVGGGDGPVSHLLGLMVFLRLGLHLGALARECFWLFLFLSLLCLVWGWVAALFHARRDPLRSIGGLLAAQKGFLLLALSLIFREQGLEILVAVAAAYALAQGISRLSLRWLASVGSVGSGQLLSSAVMNAPLLGVPLCVALLSLTGLPPTLGFIVRAELMRLVWTLDLTWLVPWVLAMSILCLWRFVPLISPLFRGEQRGIDSPPPWSLRIALGLATAALVVLGLFPLPLVRLAGWLVGG